MGDGLDRRAGILPGSDANRREGGVVLRATRSGSGLVRNRAVNNFLEKSLGVGSYLRHPPL